MAELKYLDHFKKKNIQEDQKSTRKKKSRRTEEIARGSHNFDQRLIKMKKQRWTGDCPKKDGDWREITEQLG